MSLVKKYLLIIASLLGSLIITIDLVSSYILISGYSQLEQNHLEQDSNRLINALARNFDDLARISADWAGWDDTYRFIQGEYPNLIRLKLQQPEFGLLNIQLAFLLDDQANLIFAKITDPLTGELIDPPPQISEHFTLESPFFAQPMSGLGRTGLIMLGNEPYLMAAQPILARQFAGPIRGVLVFGRRMDARYVNQLSDLIRHDIQIYAPYDAQIPLQIRENLASSPNLNPAFYQRVDNRTVKSYLLVRDFYATPALVLQSTSERTIYRQGLLSNSWLLGITLILGLIFLLLSYILPNRLIFKPITRLSQGILRIGKSGDIAARLEETGDPEIISLAATINQTLNALQTSQQKERETEQTYRALFETSTDAIFVETLEGQILDCNLSACQMFGYRFEELTRLHVRDLVPEEVAKTIPDVIQKHQITGRIFVQSYGLRKSGDLFPTEVRTQMMEVFAQPRVVVYVRDTTQRTQMEQRILASQHLNESIIQHIPAGVAFLDEKFVLQKYNRVYADLIRLYTPFTPETAAGVGFFDVFFGSRPQLEVWFNRVQATGHAETRYGYQLVLQRNDQEISTYWDTSITPVIDGEGRSSGILILTQDVTERKHSEWAMQRYNERLRILHQIDQAILAAQSVEAPLTAALRHLQDLIPCRNSHFLLSSESGEPVRLITGSGSILLFHNETKSLQGESLPDLPAVVRTLKPGNPRLIARQELYPTIDLPFSENTDWFLVVPLVSDSRLVGCLNLGIDQPALLMNEHIEIAAEVGSLLSVAIQQNHLRENLQRYASELEEKVAERTTSLQEINQELEAFAYSVSHDLRAPLRAMQGFASALQEDYGSHMDATARDYAQRIVDASHWMDDLIQDLLSYSRISRTQLSLQPVSLTVVVGEVVRQLHDEIQTRQAGIHTLEPLHEVMGHTTTLVQVITNLVSNAIKFVPLDRLPVVKIWTENIDGKIRVWVEDNGIGIAPEHQEQIFRVFERLHGMETYPGNGIGLAIVRKGVHRIGGQVGVISTPGQGSRFWVELDEVKSAQLLTAISGVSL